MFQFLETLPNLQVLDFGELVPQHLSEFISSIRHTTLLELVLYTSNFFHVKGPPTTGLADLEKLSINWYADDNPNEPGSSLAHLYEFIRPSLTTLVEFRIELRYVFDLQLLKPTADTLRTFEYTLYSPHPCADESILDTISSILPHLTKLSIKWNNVQTEQSILWKACTFFFLLSAQMIIIKFCRTRTSKLFRNTITLLTYHCPRISKRIL